MPREGTISTTARAPTPPTRRTHATSPAVNHGAEHAVAALLKAGAQALSLTMLPLLKCFNLKARDALACGDLARAGW